MPPRGPGKAAGGAGRGRRKTLNERLLAELRRLQDDLHTIVERYEVRVGGRLNDLIRRLEGDDSIDQPARPATIKAAEAMLAAIDDTTLRTHKARAKDLRRLERLVEELGRGGR